MTAILPPDYGERVYAGVLGKLIGVYLGRPFEQWTHEKIAARWGEIRRYVHEDMGVDLVVSDDDITGTFVFVRALLDHGISPGLTSRQIGQTWLNYIAEKRHILWWGGMGTSTEHTAWLRLHGGVEAPRSGSIELNGKAVAEEIGAQIFIDGWALVSPGQPDLAAHFAQEAGRVSHDGEAIHGATLIAVMESLAFVEKDIETLLDRGLAHVPNESRVAQVVSDLRLWRKQGLDWRQARAALEAAHGYEQFDTICPVISNLSVVILALLYGEGDFDRSMKIVCTCGYDTDCNAGNLGCLLGIRNGLDCLGAGYDWRGPVNDRLYLPAADGHWALMDAANIALELANIGRVLAGGARQFPKNGARYSFSLPGATHGFAPSNLCPREAAVTAVKDGLQLEVHFPGQRSDAMVTTFISTGAKEMGYSLSATPMLYPGNVVTARVVAVATNRDPVQTRLFTQAGETLLQEGPWTKLDPGAGEILSWTVPVQDEWPIESVGIQLDGPAGSRLQLDWLTWEGTPALTFDRPANPAANARGEKMFVGSMDQFDRGNRASFQLIQNRGRGVIHTGSRAWRDYRVSARIKPYLARECALAGRVQGLTRYYGLFLRADNRLALVRLAHEETTLAEASFPWEVRHEYELALEFRGTAIQAWVDGRLLLEAEDSSLDGGGIGFVLGEGRMLANALRISPL